MSLFEGTAPPNIETSRTTATTAPQYLTDYLTNLAQAGQTALQQPNLIAGLPANLQNLYETAGSTLQRYQSPLEQAAAAGQAGATGITGSDISAFYNPYEQSVVDEMARQSGVNLQRNLLPAVKAGFVGTGGLGSQRYAGALGQALTETQRDLLGRQSQLRYEGYKSAMDAALRQKQAQTQAAQALGGIGQTEAQAGTSALRSLGDIGSQELAYEQSRIEAPLTRAQNVAQIMRGYTYPTTVTEKYLGPASAYGPSPLSQIAGLGTLIGSAFGNKDAVGNKFLDWLSKLGGSLPDVSSWNALTNSGYGTGEDYT